MQPAFVPDDEDELSSLVVILPLAVAGFMMAAASWSLFSVAGVYLKELLALSSMEFGILLAAPMALGALLAIPAGLASRKFGAGRVMVLCLAGLVVCMGFLMWVDSFAGFLGAGAGLGLAGGYYSAGLQFVIRFAPQRHTGLVLGLFGAGITGVGISYYLVPLILRAFYWPVVPLAYLIVLGLILALLLMLTSEQDGPGDDPTGTSLRGLIKYLAQPRVWQMSAWFGAVAGGFLALALWLPDYLASDYSLPLERGAWIAQWYVVPGALAQIPGGYLTDRYGSARVVSRALILCLVTLFVLSYPPMTLTVSGSGLPLHFNFALPLSVQMSLIVVLGVALGSAMAGLQRLMVAEDRTAAAVSAGAFLVCACSVGFVLPVVFGAVNQWIGIRSGVFMILFILFALCLVSFLRDSRRREREAILHRGL